MLKPPALLPVLGPLVAVDGECPYFKDGRVTSTLFAVPGVLSGAEYEVAMGLGMRRSGAVVYRPVCDGCRKCQPFRVDVTKFIASRSQRRVVKRCEGRFTVTVGRPVSDAEHLELYARYQREQHGADGQSPDADSYERFLCETLTDTFELTWRDRDGSLAAVGVIDVVPDGVSTVYFFWEPRLRDLSLGVYSALYEIELCRQWNKRYYYLGYVVPGAATMAYKAGYHGGEVSNGTTWEAVPTRDVDDPQTAACLAQAESLSQRADAQHFRLAPQNPSPPAARP